MGDLGSQGDKAPVHYKDPEEGGTPKTGFDSAPKSSTFNFEDTKGFGGTNKGAH